MEKVTRFSISIEGELMEKFSRFMKENGYKNRSKAISDLIRGRLLEEEWKNKKGKVFATVTLVYDHEIPNLLEKLTHIQHHFLKEIIFSSHVHLNEHNCMEIIVIHGTVRKINEFKRQISNHKGVKLVKIVPASTGSLEI